MLALENYLFMCDIGIIINSFMIAQKAQNFRQQIRRIKTQQYFNQKRLQRLNNYQEDTYNQQNQQNQENPCIQENQQIPQMSLDQIFSSPNIENLSYLREITQNQDIHIINQLLQPQPLKQLIYLCQDHNPDIVYMASLILTDLTYYPQGGEVLLDLGFLEVLDKIMDCNGDIFDNVMYIILNMTQDQIGMDEIIDLGICKKISDLYTKEGFATSKDIISLFLKQMLIFMQGKHMEYVQSIILYDLTVIPLSKDEKDYVVWLNHLQSLELITQAFDLEHCDYFIEMDIELIQTIMVQLQKFPIKELITCFLAVFQNLTVCSQPYLLRLSQTQIVDIILLSEKNKYVYHIIQNLFSSQSLVKFFLSTPLYDYITQAHIPELGVKTLCYLIISSAEEEIYTFIQQGICGKLEMVESKVGQQILCESIEKLLFFYPYIYRDLRGILMELENRFVDNASEIIEKHDQME